MAKKKTRRPRPRPRAEQSDSAPAKAPNPAIKRRERAAARAAAAKKKQKQRTVLAWAVGGVLVLGVGAWAFLGGGEAASGVTDPLAWDLPAFGPTADTQERVRLADFEGTPTIVNFFASWCVECDNELPYFSTISRELEGRVDFVGVASAESGNPMTMPNRHDIDWWPLARDVGGLSGNDLAVSLGMRPGAMPLTVFYDAGGNVVNVNPGAIREDVLRASITQLYGIEF